MKQTELQLDSKKAEGGESSQPLQPELMVTLDLGQGCFYFEWLARQDPEVVARGRLSPTELGLRGFFDLDWRLEAGGKIEQHRYSNWASSIRSLLSRVRKRFEVPDENLRVQIVTDADFGPVKAGVPYPLRPPGAEPGWTWLGRQLQQFARMLNELDPDHDLPPTERGRRAARMLADSWVEHGVGGDFPLGGRFANGRDPLLEALIERDRIRAQRREERQRAENAKRLQNLARMAQERRQRELRAAEQRKAAESQKRKEAAQATLESKPPHERQPLPAVPIHVEPGTLEFQETTFPLSDLQGYFLRERAALWWVSNQSDDLLCLPYCRIEHLDYQLRTALRVLGPLRGRALLSDEVGLGKTIEAGLVLKELLTRGLVKRFLVLTVPSLVDQWEEELNEKFGLSTATTNQAAVRADGGSFWRENRAIIASLHTLKQPAHLEVARQVHWDMLIVDEAHYLRNRDSQAWQAVSALPRQFLLLISATPVQNSLEELYNLVTLLRPGQLPTPKEFRARFIDRKRPRQPREPEELRRLLGQVMVRNTRANAGLNLPPRHAETVLFEPNDGEREFWGQWEAEFRQALGGLNASQASMWGRLVLQAAGSSPAAWRDALESFPKRALAQDWRQRAPLEASWRRKCELIEPLTRGEGGVVIFTQFLRTQAALAEHLGQAGIQAFVINGSTPPPARQPITEEFRDQGGALLLTHSGTEGRNLQFCHRLGNFDLPWNPMEIEQRIGRLHRLGQKSPVRIYNFVQSGTLQEHLLQILQDKLNLFELVVGETGLVLGERFSSDEFAEEVLRRWRESDGRVAEAMTGLGEDLAAARAGYDEVKKLDETLFEHDYESI
jgi:superfamily II DNA or RNA helicase